MNGNAAAIINMNTAIHSGANYSFHAHNYCSTGSLGEYVISGIFLGVLMILVGMYIVEKLRGKNI